MAAPARPFRLMRSASPSPCSRVLPGHSLGGFRRVDLAARPRPPKRRRRGRLGLVGQMRFDELAPRHRAGPEPGGEPVEKLGKRASALRLVRALELALRRRERLGRKAGEAHEVDAIAGVDGLFVRARQPLGEEPHDRARFVERPGGADADAAHVAVDAIELELDPPRALGLALEQHHKIVGELAQRRLDRLKRLHGRSKPPLGAKSGGGKRGAIEPRSRPLSASSRAIVMGPNRAAIGARGLSAMSPIRLRPARARSATVFSSRPSAASGRSWKSLAKALSLRGSGAIFVGENRASAQAARGLPATPAATVSP